MNTLTNLFWFFLFLPFVSPFPINTDVQPLCGVLGIAIIYRSKRLNSITILFSCCLLLGFLFSIIFYINNPLFDPIAPLLRKGSALFFGFITYQAVLNVRHSLSVNHLLIPSFIYTAFASLFLINASAAKQLQDIVIRTTKINLDNLFSYRGFALLASEPSFSACAIFLILLITLFCRYKPAANFKLKKNFIIFSSIALMLYTKSGAGYLLLTSLLIYEAILHRGLLSGILRLKTNTKNLLIIVAVLSSIFSLILFNKTSSFDVATNRGAQLISAILSDTDTLRRLTADDSSIGLRLSQFLAQLQAIMTNPLIGYGFQGSACFQDLTTGCENNTMISTFLYYTLSIGILFPLTIYWLLKRSPQLFYLKTISLGFLMFSLSYAFPGPWTLLALQSRNSSSKSS